MVKNTGGNKAKKFASKSVNIPNKATRFSSDPAEVYAVVNKMMGGSICEVLCIDGITRSCVIRRKFSGKGKRDNWLSKGKWILVGLRDWESAKEKDKCDLLEVYNDNDKEKLIKNSKDNFRIFMSITADDSVGNDENIEFINSREEELFDEGQDECEDEGEGEHEKQQRTFELPDSDGDSDGGLNGDLDGHFDSDLQSRNLDKDSVENRDNILSITQQIGFIDIDDI
jgi:initiation factor 1A